MPRTVTPPRQAVEANPTDYYPVDLLPELRRTLAALARAEIRNEAARERTQQVPDALGHQCPVEMETRYQRERQRHVERLEQLQNLIRSQILGGL
jgi:hypothetical protein